MCCARFSAADTFCWRMCREPEKPVWFARLPPRWAEPANGCSLRPICCRCSIWAGAQNRRAYQYRVHRTADRCVHSAHICKGRAPCLGGRSLGGLPGSAGVPAVSVSNLQKGLRHYHGERRPRSRVMAAAVAGGADPGSLQSTKGAFRTAFACSDACRYSVRCKKASRRNAHVNCFIPI